MWDVESSSFDLTCARLHGRLIDKVPVDILVAAVGKCFAMATMTVEQEARRVVGKTKRRLIW